MEQFGLETSRKEFSLEETNRLQYNLIKESNADPSDWIEDNAIFFREIIKTNSNLRDLYEKDPEAAMRFIKQQLDSMHQGSKNEEYH